MKFLYSVLIITICIYAYNYHMYQDQKKGIIILLNGASSSGKTSIAQNLQDLFTEPYLHISIDGFLSTLPKRFWGPDAQYAHLGFQWVEHHDEHGPLTVIKTGPWSAKLVAGMYYAIAGLALQGNNIIQDDVILRKEALDQAVKALKGFTVYFIGVKAPLAVLEERERQRGDRALHMARSQYQLVHSFALYDFEVDTSSMSAQECARAIIKYIETHPKPTAFAAIK